MNVLGDPIPGINNFSGSSNIVSVESVNESANPNSIDFCFEYCPIILKSEVGVYSISRSILIILCRIIQFKNFFYNGLICTNYFFSPTR